MPYLTSRSNACYGTPQLHPKEQRSDILIIQYLMLTMDINKAKTRGTLGDKHLFPLLRTCLLSAAFHISCAEKTNTH